MPDIVGGEVFNDGEAFNAARANNQLNAATILPAFLTGKPAVAHADVVPANDLLLLFQASSSLLKKITIEEFLLIGGHVSSVALTMPAGFTVTGGGSGDVALVTSFSAQSGNKHLASPADGSSAAPTFRARSPQDSRYGSVSIAAADIDWSLANSFEKSFSTPLAFTFSNAFPAVGAEIAVALLPNDNTYTWPSYVVWANGVPLTPVNTSLNLFRFINVNGTIYGSLIVEGGF